jgi:hypothetical protein
MKSIKTIIAPKKVKNQTTCCNFNFSLVMNVKV